MKKIFLIVLLILFTAVLPCSAVSMPSIENENSNADSNTGENIATDIEIPDNVRAYLKDKNITINDDGTFSGLTELSPENILSDIWQTVIEQSITPLRLMFSLIAIVFVCAIVAGLADSVKIGTVESVFAIICVLACVLSLSSSLIDCFQKAQHAIQTGSGFMLSYIPIYSTVTAATGNISSAMSFNILIMLVSDVAMQIANYMLMPLLGVCFSLAIVDAINPSIKLKGLIKGINSIVKWGLGLMMAIFTGILSLQTTMGAAVNSLEQKAAKFIVANAVPVVGGAVSDAYTTVRGSLNLLKSGVGSIGVISVAVIVLPVIISLAIYRIAITVSKIAADITDVEPLQDLFENVGDVITLVFSITICFALMLIISTAIVMSSS